MGSLEKQSEKLETRPSVSFFSRFSQCGIWTQLVWIFWVNTNNDVVGSYVPWQTIYLVTAVSMAVMAMVYFMLKSKGPLTQSRGMIAGWIWTICTTASTVIIMMANVLLIPAYWSVVFLVLGGIGYSWLYLAWGSFYGRLDIRRAIEFLFVAGIVSSCIKELLTLLPYVISGSIVSCLPILSLITCKHSLTSWTQAGKAPVYFTKQNISSLWKVMLTFIIFSIASASMISIRTPSESLGSSWIFLVERVIEIVLCACVLLYVLRFKRSFDFVQLWRIVLLLMATNFLLNILFPASGIQTLFSGSAINFIVLFVWLVLSDVAHHSNIPSVLIFGIGWGCYTLPFYLGSLLVIAGDYTDYSFGYFAVLMYAIAIVAAICLETRDQNTKLIFTDLDGETSKVPEDFDSIDKRCEAVEKQYGLTAREVEVMELLCKGRSKAYIAETLFVTENTIKGHAKRLYTKLNVHSKKELQQLIDVY